MYVILTGISIVSMWYWMVIICATQDGITASCTRDNNVPSINITRGLLTTVLIIIQLVMWTYICDHVLAEWPS